MSVRDLARKLAGRGGDEGQPSPATAVEPPVGPDQAPAATDGEEAPERPLVGLADPAAELLRGAMPYSDAPAELPDDQPIPSLRLTRRPQATGLVVAVERYRDDERIGGDELQVDRLPFDRSITPPRRRRNPMPTSMLHLTSDTTWAGPADAAGPGPAGGAPGTVRLALPAEGPERSDVLAVLEAARSHRMVVLDETIAGDVSRLASLVLHVVAAGTSCWCPPGLVDRLELLSPELRSLLHFDLAEVADDDLRLASRIARQKRAAWLGHDLRVAWRPGQGEAWEPWLRPVPWPAVSVLLVSRRPSAVPGALEMIAAQEGVDLEVVVALHGGGDRSEVDRARTRLGLDGGVTSVPAAVPFGAVLNHAVALSSAPVVLKWDDDDLYGPRHVQDLLVARRQTGAALVGKAAEFVYFEGSGRTVWRNPGRAEADSMGMAGGTFLTDRALLDEVGGYPDVARAVDHHLKVRLRDRGTHPFRTHGFGFVLRRHAQGHTWEASEEQLAAKALRSFEGLPDLLELGAAATSTHLPEG